MKKNILIFTFVISGYFLGCTDIKSDEHTITEIKLKGQSYYLKNEAKFSLDPISIVKIDTFLVFGNVQNFYTQDSVYTILDIKNHKILKNYGIKGKGPQEDLDFDIYKSSIGRHFEIYSESFKYNRISLDSIINGNSTIYSTQFDFSKVNLKESESSKYYLGVPFNAFSFNDSIFITKGFYNSGQYGLYDVKNNQIDYFGNYPDKNNNVSKIQKASIYSNSMLRFHPQRSIFVSPYSASDGFEICEIDLNKFEIRRLFSTYTYLPKYSISNNGSHAILSRNAQLGLTNCAVSDYLIYFTKSDTRFKDALSNNRIYYKSNKIYAYDWEGNHKFTYVLDRPIRSFTIDEENRIIYAIVEDPELELYFFKIPS